MSELRTMIRELLLEELGKIKESASLSAAERSPREDVVEISSSADLCRFASSVLVLARDAGVAEKIEFGTYPFHLSVSPSRASQGSAENLYRGGTGIVPEHFAKGIVTEKDVASLDAEVRQVSCGASVCLTPLARDALRRREITVVRKSS